MWRLGLLALASCSLISTSAQASGPYAAPGAPSSPATTTGAAESTDDPPRVSSPTADNAPAKLPPTVSPPDVPAPAVAVSKGPFSKVIGYDNVFLPASREPASPWAGVAKGRPVTLPLDYHQWEMRDESLTCTAALDHCLPAYTWFHVEKVVTSDTHRNAYPVVFVDREYDDRGRLEKRGLFPKRPSRYATGSNPPYTAYRSVPATKKNLVAGARVFAFPDAAIPTGTAGVYDRWQMGIVARVDWDLGMVFLEELEQPFFITAARVAVLAFEPETGVTILGGKKRDELAVKAADVVLP